ncbi:MAG: hypothetical protein K0U98_05980 [Deltaproteobacteria bacterium]|nr:hypothetical protein [Deltaproteobacteria bacterium]
MEVFLPFRFARGEAGWRVDIDEPNLRPSLSAKLMNTLGRGRVPEDIAIVGHFRALDDWWVSVAREAGSSSFSGVAVREEAYRQQGFDPFSLLEKRTESAWITAESVAGGGSYLSDARTRFGRIPPKLRENEFWSVRPRGVKPDASPASSYRVGRERPRLIEESSSETLTEPQTPPGGEDSHGAMESGRGPENQEGSEPRILQAISELRERLTSHRGEALESKELGELEKRIGETVAGHFEALSPGPLSAEISDRVVASLPRRRATSWPSQLVIAGLALALGILGGLFLGGRSGQERRADAEAPAWFRAWEKSHEEEFNELNSAIEGLEDPTESIVETLMEKLRQRDQERVSQLAQELSLLSRKEDVAPPPPAPCVDPEACKTLFELLDKRGGREAKEHARDWLVSLGCSDEDESSEEGS